MYTRERPSGAQPPAYKLFFARDQRLGGRARVRRLPEEVLDASSHGRVGQAQAVRRPERRTCSALERDRGKQFVPELIDPDVLPLTLLDAHREPLAVGRQAGARKHPWCPSAWVSPRPTDPATPVFVLREAVQARTPAFQSVDRLKFAIPSRRDPSRHHRAASPARRSPRGGLHRRARQTGCCPCRRRDGRSASIAHRSQTRSGLYVRPSPAPARPPENVRFRHGW